MSDDRVYPSAKPSNSTPNGTAPAPAPPTPTVPPKLPPQLYRPYRPQPSHRRTRRRCRCTFCCCCFWTVLFLLTLSFLATIAGAALYVLYRPRRPAFSVSALRATTLNLTASDADPSISHLVTSFNLTLTSKNPNSHFTFFYDQVTVTFLSGKVFVGNASIAPFTSYPNNQTVFRGVAVSGDVVNLDTEDLNALRADLKRSRGIPLKIEMETKVRVKSGKMKSKKVGFRVICDGFKGLLPPKAKSPSVATVTDSECKVDLRFKIWKFTF